MQLLETIKVDQGKVFFISFHNERFNSSRQALFGIQEKVDLSTLINPPDLNCYRCRIIYSEKIEKIEFIPCQNRQFKIFQIVHDDHIDYEYKYLDRRAIQKLEQLKKEADDILIIKQGLITDISIANVAFFDGEQWITPTNPLLKGTTRERLLQEGKIKPATIDLKEIKKCSKMALMNALLGFTVLKEFYLIGG
jgi:4-amino-4-deoxychorismate lyase